MKEAGIESVVEAAIDAFLIETPGRMKTLEAAVAAGDWTTVEREAHGIKSGARNLRADVLGELLEKVELAGKEALGKKVVAVMPELRTSLQEVLGYLEEQGREAQ